MNEQQIISLVCARPNKRPTVVSAEMAKEAAMKTAGNLLRSGGFDKTDTAESLADDILYVTRYDRFEDGYALAVALERNKGWMPDATMVEILDGFSSECSALLHAAEKQWGIENPMEPPLPLGTKVIVRGETGFLDHIHKYSPAYYCVKAPSISHGFMLVRFEDAKAAP